MELSEITFVLGGDDTEMRYISDILEETTYDCFASDHR